MSENKSNIHAVQKPGRFYSTQKSNSNEMMQDESDWRDELVKIC